MLESKVTFRYVLGGIIFVIFCITLSYCKPQNGNEFDAIEHKLATANLPVKQLCTVSDLANWFENNQIIENGIVTPANSLGSFTTRCDFYSWAWRNFLWLTSPTAPDSIDYVFQSNAFYELEGDSLVQEPVVKGVRGAKPDAVGQAGGGGTLISQSEFGLSSDSSLVYYGIHVNDVYAYFVSGYKLGFLTSITEFPTNEEGLDSILNFAKDYYGVPTPADSQALTMEVKTSWVLTSAVEDSTKYICTSAMVPVFTHESPALWTWDGTTLNDVRLALVGIHIVGPVTDHPEMVWASFEHVDNTSDVNYYYQDTNGVTKKVENISNGNPVSGFLFTDSTTSVSNSNAEYMKYLADSLKANLEHTISASSTVRVNPFGSDSTPSSALNNSEIISLNQFIQNGLAPGDLRQNYFLLGATWTNGVIPTSPGAETIGSSTLANSTMETYFQSQNCFGCHQNGGSPSKNLDGLSHIFGKIEGLPKPVK